MQCEAITPPMVTTRGLSLADLTLVQAHLLATVEEQSGGVVRMHPVNAPAWDTLRFSEPGSNQVQDMLRTLVATAMVGFDEGGNGPTTACAVQQRGRSGQIPGIAGTMECGKYLDM